MRARSFPVRAITSVRQHDGICDNNDSMIRTQVQFTDQQIKSLRELSAVTGRSIADLIRDAVTLYLQRSAGPSHEVLIERAIAVAGQFGSGSSDVSSQHDHYLSETSGHGIR